jgi:hypothetical protein
MRAVRPFVRFFLTLVGLALVAAAFLGTLYFGSVNNRPVSRVLMAYRDIGVGERINAADLKVAELPLDPGLARLYVTESELDQFQSAVVVDVLRRGDPLSKAKLNVKGDLASGGARGRYALVLDNPNDVVLTLPVEQDYIPNGLSTSDSVNILLVAGNDINQLPRAREESVVSASSQTATPTPRANAMPQATPTPQLALPLADVMLERVPVLDVNRKQLPNPNAGPDRPGEPAFVNGEITSIVVKVPRTHQAILSFGASTKRLRFAVVSPQYAEKDVKPQLGVSWNAYVDLWDWKQKEAAARGETLQGILYPRYTPVAPTSTPARAADAQPQDLPTPVTKPARP